MSQSDSNEHLKFSTGIEAVRRRIYGQRRDHVSLPASDPGTEAKKGEGTMIRLAYKIAKWVEDHEEMLFIILAACLFYWIAYFITR